MTRHRSLAPWLIMLALGGLGALAHFAQAQPAKPDFDAIFNEQGLAMLLIDPASGRIVEANAAAASFYGHSRETLRTMSIQQINTFTPEQVAQERKLAESEGRNYFIFRHRLASGEVRTVDVHSHPYEFDGKRRLLSVIHDITPGRREAQDMWHYQERLEEMVDAQVREIKSVRRRQSWLMALALAAQTGVIVWLAVIIRRKRRLERERGALLATVQARNAELARLGEVMTHHFQEPVRRLASFAQRLQKKSALTNDEDSRQSLRFIDAEARRLSNLVRDVQRYLALDQMPAIVAGAADAAQVWRQAVAAAGEEAGEAQIVQRAMPARVAVAAKSLQYLFGLLIDNALRHRRPERNLRIEASARIDGARAEFRIADNGVGIAPEYREQVFGLFARLAPSGTAGTGVGLTLARKLVTMAGGDIRVEDGIDGGACIVFDLPLARE